MAKAATKNTSKAKAKSPKATKAKAKNTAAPKVRKPLTPEQVKVLLNEHPELKAFRSGTAEGRKIVHNHLTSGEVGDDAAKFAHKMKTKGLSYREIEAGMGLAPHNGMSAYRLVKRGRPLNAADTKAANKAKNSAPAPKAEAKTEDATPTPDATPATETVVTAPTADVKVEAEAVPA